MKGDEKKRSRRNEWQGTMFGGGAIQQLEKGRRRGRGKGLGLSKNMRSGMLQEIKMEDEGGGGGLDE